MTLTEAKEIAEQMGQQGTYYLHGSNWLELKEEIAKRITLQDENAILVCRIQGVKINSVLFCQEPGEKYSL